MSGLDLESTAKRLRRMSLAGAARSRSSHIGGVLSMLDLLTCLFYDVMRPGDHFILSKGHATLGLYAVLQDRGVISEAAFDSYHMDGSILIGHPSHFVDGVEVSTGSLGHGPAVAAGLALGLRGLDPREMVYCLLGDGECQEGSVWEALIFIAREHLDNLVLIIDANGWQGYSDPSSSLLSERALVAMLRGTGLDVREVDGHSFSEIRPALTDACDRARVVVARTTKGKGVSFMENRFEWHYKSPNDSELALALDELT